MSLSRSSSPSSWQTPPSASTSTGADSRTQSQDTGQKRASPLTAPRLDSPQLDDDDDDTASHPGEPSHVAAPPHEPLLAAPPPHEPLSAYSCPICFSPPLNATLTPCGHICCGSCLFTAIRTATQRAQTMMADPSPSCPVCRAPIPGWDGKGGGVIGLTMRVVWTL